MEMASVLSESSSEFSSLPNSQDVSMTELQGDGPHTGNVKKGNNQSCLEIVPFRAFNPFSTTGSRMSDDEDGAPCPKKTRLVLVGSGDHDQGSRDESPKKLGNVNEDSDSMLKVGNVEIEKILSSFTGLAKQFQTFSEENPLDEFRKSLRSLTDHMEALSQQVRETQLLFLKNTLSTASFKEAPSTAPSSVEPPTRGIQMIRIKCEDEGIKNDVFRTPKKSDDLGSRTARLDVTPTTSFGAVNQDQVVAEDDHINISNILSSRRSSMFPKSLGDMLDKCADNGNEKLSRDAAIQTEEPYISLQNYRTPKTIEPSPPPLPISFMQIKKEPIDSEESQSPSTPLRKPKAGLLVLADALNAMKQSRAEKSLKDLRSDSDSGRSTGGSNNGSPVMQSAQRPTFVPIEKFSFGKQDKELAREVQMDDSQRTLPPSPTGSSSSSSMTDLKARKRRKVKEPLPCSFCGKIFSNQSSLRQHESFHRPMRPYKCEHEKCEKAYKTRSELNRHVVVHSGEKKHFCKLCGKKFLRKQYLKTHLLRHHETGITMVTPSAKGIDASIDPAMMMSATSNVPVAVVPSAFVSKPEPLTWRCQLCMKIFVNNEDLMKHVRSYHEKKRPAGTSSSVVIVTKGEEKVEKPEDEEQSKS